ncbi:MAG: serine--tRNA ligase [Candidatus Babeliaceae bacterium]
MIDLNLLRQEPEKISALIKRKDPLFPIEQLIAYEHEYRSLNHSIELLRAEKNELARQAQKGITKEVRQRSKEISTQIKEQEARFQAIEKLFYDLYLKCPNLPAEDIPVGGKEANKVMKVFKDKPLFDFSIKNHLELGKQLRWFDFEAAARLAGNNFVVYHDQAVTLLYALTIFMFNTNRKHGYVPCLPPYVVNEKSLECAGNFPRFKEEVYAIPADGLYLIPTAEVSLTNMYRDHIFTTEALPLRMTSWTSCFRREAGSYGATERGLIRLHEFEKVELYAICLPEESVKEQERMLACAEEILQKLGLHYRVSLLATQDCSFQSMRTFDIEVWMPGQNEYKEVSSMSDCGTFQARRAQLRYRDALGQKTHLVHTLNGSSLALPRLMVALMETYQQDDGTIALPDVLKSVSLEL